MDETTALIPAVDDLPFPALPKDMLIVKEKSRLIINMINTKMNQVSRHSSRKDFMVDHEVDPNIVPMPYMTTVLYVIIRTYNEAGDYVCNYSHTKDKKNTYTIHIKLSDKHTKDAKNDEKIAHQIQYLKSHKVERISEKAT